MGELLYFRSIWYTIPVFIVLFILEERSISLCYVALDGDITTIYEDF